MQHRLIATCPEETKEITMEELASLGATGIEAGYRSVSFSADTATVYRISLLCRTASRILRVIKDIPASTPEMLFSQSRRIPWSTIFNVHRTYLIEGIQTQRGPEFLRSNDISKKVREGLEQSFLKQVGRKPKVDLKEPKVVIVAFVQKGRCLLSVDTSGKALHKRGYRLPGHPAPLKETLAAAMLKMMGYDGSQAFLDPMCGSGTIAIEAAMVALHKAPQIHRKKGQFRLEWLEDFDSKLWRQIQDQVRAERLPTPPRPLFASDISGDYVEMARRNALRARVEKDIHFEVGAFENRQAPAQSGILLTNLPYGERLGGDEDLRAFYGTLGDTLKQNFKGWRVGLLAAVGSPYKFIGLKPNRRIPLMNGSIECRLLVFDIYEGSRKERSRVQK